MPWLCRWLCKIIGCLLFAPCNFKMIENILFMDVKWRVNIVVRLPIHWITTSLPANIAFNSTCHFFLCSSRQTKPRWYTTIGNLSYVFITLSCTEATQSVISHFNQYNLVDQSWGNIPSWIWEGLTIDLESYDTKFDTNVILETAFHENNNILFSNHWSLRERCTKTLAIGSFH